MSFKPCVVVPSYNHYRVVAEVIAGLQAHKLPVIVIDDGSAEPTKGILAALHDPSNGVFVEHLPTNQGKGAAVIRGFREAVKRGYSHAVQIDADGQHDSSALPNLLALAQKHPEALISGKPIYDGSIPTSRKIARWFTHVWVWGETLSLQITDSMCGFRVYPLSLTMAVVDSERVGQRMDFDTELMVRLFWRGVPAIMTPVRVTYPEDNTSNFDLLHDNWRITKMHTRLVFTMLFRLPRVLKNRPRNPEASVHWAAMDERGMDWGLRVLASVYQMLGKRACGWVMQPILLYFFLSGGRQRQASAGYWQRLYRETRNADPVTWRMLFSHFQSFGAMALDKFAAWMGDITLNDLILPEDGAFEKVADSGKGVLLITSHLGNVEVSRALSRQKHAINLTVFAHTEHAVKFNRLLTRYSPGAAVNVVQVSEMGPATAIDLEARISRGEWVVIAGDRIPVQGQKRLSGVEFLGEIAPFSQGPVILGALLRCPVYMLLCVREGPKYRLLFEKLADRIELPRKTREAAIQSYLRVYAGWLEKNCKAYPEQWYNFFDFWGRQATGIEQQK